MAGTMDELSKRTSELHWLGSALLIAVLSSCAHAPDVPKKDRSSGLDLAPIAARYGLPRCEVSVPITQEDAVRHVARWYSFNLEDNSEWMAMVAAAQPGDQLRQVYCLRKGRPGGNVFFGLFRDGVLAAETQYIILD